LLAGNANNNEKAPFRANSDYIFIVGNIITYIIVNVNTFV